MANNVMIKQYEKIPNKSLQKKLADFAYFYQPEKLETKVNYKPLIETIQRGAVSAEVSGALNKTAEDQYTQLINEKIVRAEIYTNYGIAYAVLGRKSPLEDYYDLAFKNFEKAIETNPYFTKAHLERGKLFFRLQMYEEALKDLNQTIRFDRNCASAFKFRSYVYRELADNEPNDLKAEELYKKAAWDRETYETLKEKD